MQKHRKGVDYGFSGNARGRRTVMNWYFDVSFFSEKITDFRLVKMRFGKQGVAEEILYDRFMKTLETGSHVFHP